MVFQEMPLKNGLRVAKTIHRGVVSAVKILPCHGRVAGSNPVIPDSRLRG